MHESLKSEHFAEKAIFLKIESKCDEIAIYSTRIDCATKNWIYAIIHIIKQKSGLYHSFVLG